MNNTIELMRSHVSVRSFTDQAVASELLETVLQAGQAASTSGFIQAYSVIRVTDPAKRATLAAAAGGQQWVIDAPEFLVFCADLNRLNRAGIIEGNGELEGYTEHAVAAIVDVALFAQNVLLAAESVGLGGVFIGGIRNDTATVIEQLQLPANVHPVFGMCLGYPATKNDVKPRLPLHAVLHKDVYDEASIEGNLADYNEQIKAYYEARGVSSQRNWNQTVSNGLQKKKTRAHARVLTKPGVFQTLGRV